MAGSASGLKTNAAIVEHQPLSGRDKMGCCAGGKKGGNRRTKGVVIPGKNRTRLSKMPRAGKRKDRRTQGRKR
jgi:hypothetical protein